MRIFQQDWNSSNNFSTYKDIAFTDGTGATGTWPISITGSAATVTTNANLTGDIFSTGNTTFITPGVIVDADINANAGITLTKLATGALPTAITVASANIVNDTIVDADISTNAQISLSKLATGALPTAITVASANIVPNTIVDADISTSAAIAFSKLATGALPTAITVASANIVNDTIVDADISTSAGIALAKLAAGTLPAGITVNSDNIVPNTIVDADISTSAGILDSKLSSPGTGNYQPAKITTTNASLFALTACRHNIVLQGHTCRLPLSSENNQIGDIIELFSTVTSAISTSGANPPKIKILDIDTYSSINVPIGYIKLVCIQISPQPIWRYAQSQLGNTIPTT
jgi:hypothetical protein